MTLIQTSERGETATLPGRPAPLGARVENGGVNFSVFSKNATSVELLLFDHQDDPRPGRTIVLQPKRNRTFHYWHVFVPGIGAGQIYAYRAHGPFEPEKGHRFDGDKVLLDPYGLAVCVPKTFNREAGSQPGDNSATAMKSVVAEMGGYDWEGDRPLNRPYSRTIIYEMHVGGFTRHPSSGVEEEKRGTYLGLIDKIPYLVDLGVTAVELLPVFQFDEQEAPPGLTNYWGYNPVSFFAPHYGYSTCHGPLCVLDEFRDMVKALHKARIEVILDVVYNHTAEGDHTGPTISFRGLENSMYYIADQNDRSRYANFSGTGNTLNATNTIVRRLILDSLHYWVEEMHVDGFRFDLAAILSRGEDGRPLENPPTLWDVESDPRLAGTKLIAEAWDAAGLYQVGRFVGDRWTEWNGKFRDDVRAFVRGDRYSARPLPARIMASPDLYAHRGREPEHSINFVTCHDGFTLNDLVSYNEKHNEDNNEGNRDGSDYNLSWNHGVEGPTADADIESTRNRQVKNFLALTLLSFGTPMLTMGDEMRRSQGGNNNAYCQDNEISWLDWRLLERHADIHRFVKQLITMRRNLDLHNNIKGMTLVHFLREAEFQWHGTRLNRPDWGDNSHSMAVTIRNPDDGSLLHMIINAYWEELAFELPPSPGGQGGLWRLLVDTNRPRPEDISQPATAPDTPDGTYKVGPRSVVLLLAEVPTNSGR